MDGVQSPSRPIWPFAGDGETARRMRAQPWASLRLTAAVLARRPAHGYPDRPDLPVPMIVSCGEQLLLCYNDAFRLLMGNMHPGLMRPVEQVLVDIWPTVGPMLHSVLDTRAVHLVGGPAAADEPAWLPELANMRSLRSSRAAHG